LQNASDEEKLDIAFCISIINLVPGRIMEEAGHEGL
jgi:hypothetical protein